MSPSKVHVKPEFRFEDKAEHFKSTFNMDLCCVDGASGFSLGNFIRMLPPTGIDVLN